MKEIIGYIFGVIIILYALYLVYIFIKGIKEIFFYPQTQEDIDRERKFSNMEKANKYNKKSIVFKDQFENQTLRKEHQRKLTSLRYNIKG